MFREALLSVVAGGFFLATGSSPATAQDYGIDYNNWTRTNHGAQVNQAHGKPQKALAPVAEGASADPCALLNLADATAAFGSPVVNAPHAGTPTCQYQSRTQAGNGVTLQLNEGGREKFDFDRNQVSGAKPLNGIGDEAFEFVSAAGFVQVYVIKGERYFTLTLMNARDHHLKQSAAVLARKLAARE